MEQETLATEIIRGLKDELFDKDGVMEDCLTELEQSRMALSMIKNNYEWGHVPDVMEMYKVHTTPRGNATFTEDEIRSWKYATDYEEIMFLVNVALDYCFKAIKIISQEVSE